MIVTALRRNGRPLTLTMVLLGIALSAAPVNAAYMNCPGAALVQSAARSFAAASRSRDPAQFAVAVSRYSDVGSLALFALGPYRSSLPPGRKAAYVAKVRTFMGHFLADHARVFANATLEIESCVDGRISSAAGGRDIVWRISGNRVRDVQVEGVWLVAELRSKFVSVLNRGHGDIDVLFNFLDRNS